MASGGLTDWRQRRRERRRIRLVICAGSAGCVERACSLPLLALAREVAAELDFAIEPTLVVVGGRPYGEGSQPVTPRIAENADSWLDEVQEVIRANRVRFGADYRQVPAPAPLPPASVLYFNGDCADAESGEISPEARQSYLTQAGLTAAIGLFSGALSHANSLDAVLSPADAVIRQSRIYGHGIDRGQLAAHLNETRSTRLCRRYSTPYTAASFPIPATRRTRS